MGSPSDDFACLLETPSPVEADLARGLLDEAGIPCMLHGRDADFAEWGASAHQALTRPSLYVPRSALEEAQAVLAAAWGTPPPLEDTDPNSL